MKIQIRHRYTYACLYETEIPDGTERPMRRAVVEAVAKKRREHRRPDPRPSGA